MIDFIMGYVGVLRTIVEVFWPHMLVLAAIILLWWVCGKLGLYEVEGD